MAAVATSVWVWEQVLDHGFCYGSTRDTSMLSCTLYDALHFHLLLTWNQMHHFKQQCHRVDDAVEDHRYNLSLVRATTVNVCETLTPKNKLPSMPLRVIVSASSVFAIPGASADLKGPTNR